MKRKKLFIRVWAIVLMFVLIVGSLPLGQLAVYAEFDTEQKNSLISPVGEEDFTNVNSEVSELVTDSLNLTGPSESITSIMSDSSNESFFNGGVGSEDDPYQVATAEQLAKLAELVNEGNVNYNNKHYRLEYNIDLSSYGRNYDDGKGWIPIGNESEPFKGNFDGNDKIITGLYIDRNANFQGLFGYINGGTVRNVGLTNVEVSGSDVVGGVAGYLYNGSNISNSYSSGEVSGSDAVGGVVGFLVNRSSISNSYSSGEVSGDWNVGGVAGYLDNSSISNSYSSADISDSWNNVGGVAGSLYNGSTISNSYSSGEVSGGWSVGGVAGYLENSSISNSYSSGEVSGYDYVGGIVGNMESFSATIVQDSAALNSSVSGGYHVGRVVGNKGVNSYILNSIAFSEMAITVNEVPKNIESNENSENGMDGKDITVNQIVEDGTLRGLFTGNPWTVADGFLPGLFGNIVDIPEHISQAPIIITESIPNGTVGVPYSQTLTATGYPSITWSIEEGPLPDGLSLDTSLGIISGTPTNSGTVNITVKATNNAGSDWKEITFVIHPQSSNSGSLGGGSYTPPAVTEISNGSSTDVFNLQRIISEGKTLTVAGNNGAKLIFGTDALQGISSQATDNIKVEMKDVSSEHQVSQRGKKVFSLMIMSGNATISNFNGKVSVTLPYELKQGERAENVKVWYLADNGAMSYIPSVYDVTTKLVTFTVNHFSLYVLDASSWVNPFTDIVEKDWFYSAVEHVNSTGLFFGTSPTTFSPNQPMTREMLWTAMRRMDGETLNGIEVFSDARRWAINKGISDGTNPNHTITREQLITILWRYHGSPKVESTLTEFKDASSVVSYGKDAMVWAVEKGIIIGANGALMPQDNASRAQVAVILQRYVQAIVE